MKFKRFKYDFILIISVFLLFVIFFVTWLIVSNGNKKEVLVERKDIEYSEVYDINQNQTIKIDGKISEVIIIIEDGYVYVEESGCSDKICIHTGKISKIGEQIVCLPNMVIISIKSK